MIILIDFGLIQYYLIDSWLNFDTQLKISKS
jgi:hypothetical protein